jgi:2-oxoisovalerate dehydrogenase E1 component
MYLARAADNRILELYRQGLIRGTVTGGQGNEGLCVPLALLMDKEIDVVSFSHRGFGGHLVWSGHLCDHLNQYFANAGSPTKAREGNIHHGDPFNRSLPMISHLGVMLSNVVGATDSQRRKGHPAIGLAFFGDGSSSTGDVHESLNLAALLSLPVLFIIENNGYAYSTPVSEQYASTSELWRRAEGYGIEGFRLDASDTMSTLRALSAAVEEVRSAQRPLLIEVSTLRLRGHAAYDTCEYLRPGESDAFFARDPLPRFRAQLNPAQADAVEAELNAFLEACVQVSLATPRPDPLGMEDDLFAPPVSPLPWQPVAPALPAGPGGASKEANPQFTLAQALNAGLRKILAERPESLVLGQDIATYGGAFRVTEGLLKDFGRPRVFNTPLAESGSTGYAIGLALNGHRPIAEFQFADFVTEAATQVLLNAATMHFRSGAACPLIIRLPTGGGLTLGSFHSQELDSLLLAAPGLKALYPSTPQDAFNALLAAYEDNNPVLLFEHKGLYRRGRGAVVWDPNYREVWQPKLRRSGDYATVVSYGEMVHLAGEACAYFADEYETTFDLFDLRALSPLNLDAIRASVARTGRLIVIHEGRRTHGFGAELVARLTEDNFASFKAAPLRIASLDLPVPFAPELEQAFRPTKEKIIDRISAWMA